MDTRLGFSCTGGGTLVGNRLTITGADAGNTITCTIANTYTPGAVAAQLGLLKTVRTGGGTASATDFTLTATGDASTGPTVVTGTTPVPPVNVPVGVYTLTETGPVDYTAGFSCTGGGTLVGNRLTITGADAGNTITCTIANTYTPAAVAAQLGLLKTVSGGGTASATDFTLTATGDASTGPTVVTGTTPVPPVNVPVGVYTLTETGPGGYTAGFSCSGGGTLVGNKLTITGADAGHTITCTIANTYTPAAVAAQLGLLKTVSGGGTASATDFTLTATGDASTGPTVVTGTTPVPPVNVPVGVYTLTETGPVEYTAAFSCTGGGTLVGNRLTITGADAGTYHHLHDRQHVHPGGSRGAAGLAEDGEWRYGVGHEFHADGDRRRIDRSDGCYGYHAGAASQCADGCLHADGDRSGGLHGCVQLHRWRHVGRQPVEDHASGCGQYHHLHDCQHVHGARPSWPRRNRYPNAV